MRSEWWIYLTPEFEALAEQVARNRDAAAKRLRLRNAYNPVAQEIIDYDKHLLGARTELASKFVLDPIEWHRCEDGPIPNMPDLADFIDVKGVDEHWHSLIVNPEQLRPEWAYLLTSAEERPYYLVIGWLWGHELERVTPSIVKEGRPPAHRVPSANPMLHDVRGLIEVWKDRQRKEQKR